ncbi:MAG: LysR family transcriptional regulator [Oscillospiraceae bacterium]|nr:LysR family transcriptional regulator [Oscillospiraceae bacterium]
MNQKQLSYFLEVYQSRNIQAAADKLYISHQGLSRVLRSLEEELGAELFIRSNRGLEPTDFAKTLVPHVQRLLDDYATIQGVHTLMSKEKAVVSVYALDHLFGYLGAKLVTEFHLHHPEITLSILDTTDEYALESLSSGRCDFAIVNGPIDNTRFNASKLFYSRYCLRINKSNPLADKKQLRFEDFRGQSIIGKGRAYRCFRTNIDRHLFEAGIEVDVPIETPDEELLMELVERNVGIAATYDFSAVGHCGPNTVLRYLDDTEAGHQIYLVERKNTLPTKAGRVFKSFLLAKKEMGQLSGFST